MKNVELRRECQDCKHYVVSHRIYQNGAEITYYACESWECEFEPKEKERGIKNEICNI